MNFEDQLSILVVSCDKYSDLWDTFLFLWKRYWSDCPYQVALGSNYKKADYPGVIPILIGEDTSWTNNVKTMLEQIKTPYVMMMLEDFFLCKPVKGKSISDLLKYTIENDVDCMRVTAAMPLKKVTNRELGIGPIEHGTPYYVSCHPAFWKKATLLELLRDGYSAWDFEEKNSSESRFFDYKFMSTTTPRIFMRNGVERGKYYKSTLRFLKKEGISVDLSSRGIINDYTLKRKLTLLYFRIRMRFLVMTHHST